MEKVYWMAQNQEIIKEELKEIRQLLAKAENIICSNSDDMEFCQNAKSLRMVVHDTPDPNNIKFGVETLRKLIQQMKERKIEGFEKLNKEFVYFTINSKILQIFETEDKYSKIHKGLTIPRINNSFQELSGV